MSFEDFALKVLIEDLGLEAAKITEEECETPDFIALDNDNVFFIELKEKDSSEEYIRNREAALDSGVLYSTNNNLENCRNTSNVIKKAKDQINSLASGSEFRIVWLHAKGIEKEALFEKFVCTLYGKADIFDLGKNKTNRDCYYFDYSDFYRYKSYLDGAILSKGEEMVLAINSESPKYRELLGSDFAKRFGLENVIDPLQREIDGKIWIADCENDRSKEVEILDYLRKKYSLENPRRIKMQEVRVEFSIPHTQK